VILGMGSCHSRSSPTWFKAQISSSRLHLREIITRADSPLQTNDTGGPVLIYPWHRYVRLRRYPFMRCHHTSNADSHVQGVMADPGRDTDAPRSPAVIVGCKSTTWKTLTCSRPGSAILMPRVPYPTLCAVFRCSKPRETCRRMDAAGELACLWQPTHDGMRRAQAKMT